MKQHSFIKGILLCLCVFTSISISAYDAEIDGIYYNFFGNEATVTNERSGSNSYSGNVIIPSSVSYNGKTYSVTSIGDEAFYNCSSLTSITIPNSVTKICYAAFSRCSGLTDVTIPNSVTSIGRHAFSECTGLTSFTIPNSVTSIGIMAFYHCSGLTSFKVAEGNTHYDSRNDCNAIIETATNTLVFGCQSTTIPESVTSISNNAFGECSSLTSITIPNSVTSIGEYAFTDCNSLTSVTIGNGVTSIGRHAFRGCSGLISVTIGNSVTSIGNYAFGECSSLTSITIPNSVTSIGIGAFHGCSGLTSITIPGSVTSIGNGAFYGCTGLTSVTIPESVTSISEQAFRGCSGLTSVTIPESVTSIGDNAFYDCGNLTTVEVEIEKPLIIYSNTFSNRAEATLIVPTGSITAYMAADYWKEFKTIVEKPSSVSLNVGTSGYATYCSKRPLDLSGISDFRAYIVSGFNPETSTLVLTRVTEVPAGEGLYIVGTPGTYDVPTKATAMIYSNLLKGVMTATTVSPTEGSKTNFILANGSHGIGFYTIDTAGELAAGKAYLQLPTASVAGVKALVVIFDDDNETGIITPIEETEGGSAVYNLAGQRISQPKSGLYIKNGKKEFIK